MWIEEHLFLTDVGNYISFLRSILLKDSTGLWMEPKEAMQMAKEILPYLEDSSGKESLRRKYMSEEELRSLETGAGNKDEKAGRGKENQKGI